MFWLSVEKLFHYRFTAACLVFNNFFVGYQAATKPIGTSIASRKSKWMSLLRSMSSRFLKAVVHGVLQATSELRCDKSNSCQRIPVYPIWQTWSERLEPCKLLCRTDTNQDFSGLCDYLIRLTMCQPNGLFSESYSANPNSPTSNGKPVSPNAATIWPRPISPLAWSTATRLFAIL